MSAVTDNQAQQIADWMCEHDQMARQLGMKLEEAAPGYARVSLTVRPNMLNAVGITHGGVTFTLADVAFAIASNSHGKTSVALNVSINYPAVSREGDRLTAEAKEQILGSRTGIYQVTVTRGDGSVVAIFNGTVFRRDEAVTEWMKKPEE